MSANYKKKIWWIDSLEKYAYAKKEEIIHKKDEIKCTNIKKQYKND